MPKYEIERKFLVKDESYRELTESSIEIVQAYLSRRKECTVRIRIKGERALLTIKGLTLGMIREEYEYPIPLDDARRMINMAEGPVIEKIRHIVRFEGYCWEVDEFLGRLKGLTIAEVELSSENSKPLLPPFVGEEVTGDPAYYNSNL